ncbi:MAG: hypothetical protein ABW123_01890 [Cystobacter sp.]
MPIHYQAALGRALSALSDTGASAERLLAKVPSASTPPAVQLVDPAIPWDWPTLGPNQISRQQFEFCDTQPTSCAPGVPFTSGLGSFSKAYQDFLRLIDAAKFQPLELLTQARQAATPPSYSPADAAGPAGWVVVPDSGGKDAFRPEWSVSLTPALWRLDDQPLLSQASGLTGFATGSAYAASLDAALQDAQVSATDVVRVLVYPGAWFSDVMVRLTASGPFLGTFTPEAVVGPQGILRCCITEFFVARGLTAAATLRQANEPRLRSHLASSDARFGPLMATSATLTTAPDSGGIRATLAASPDVPFIVGVTVTPVG